MIRKLGALLLLTGLIAVLPQAGAEESTDGQAWRISLGGKLYDNYWLETGHPPVKTRNPTYPGGLDTSPANTWRCVSCHGWDYRGRDGHLGKLSKSRAFVSLRETAGKPPAEIATALGSGGHRKYSQYLSDDQTEALALFLSAGQHDVTEVLGSGVPLKGKDIFEGACVSCHQADGKAYIEGESGDRPALGWVALNRPEQALHKIRNGVPGADMLSLRFLDQSRLADLIAYLKTLDPETE